MVLQAIRDRLTGILAFFILGILVIPFAFVGVNSYFTSGAENIVARVNDLEISANEFNQSYSNYRRRMQSILGPAFDPVEFDTLVARRQHLDALIDEQIISQAADAAGLEIDEERLAAEIRSIPAFQVDGVFNADVYQSRLLSQGMTPKQFELEMRAEDILRQLPQSVYTSSFATRTELQQFVSLVEQTRQFNAVLFPAESGETDFDASEEEIQAYYDGHLDAFQSEEQVVIEYLELSAVDIDTGTEPDEEFLRDRFEQQKGRFITSEQRLASHILVEVAPDADEATRETARQTAADLLARIQAGEDFAAVAREASEDLGSASQGGDLGWIEPGIMTDTFEDALYELTLDNPLSEPVQTGFGYHVIQLREIRPSTGMSFAEARELLIAEHQEEEAEREFLDRADRLVDLIYEDPTTLESAALDMGMDVQRVGPFSRAGGAGIAANAEVVRAAFSDLVLLQGLVSDPVDLGENHMVLVRLAEHLPAATRPLEAVRDQVETILREQHARDQARAAAETMLAALETAGATLASQAEAAGREVVAVESATRRDSEPDRLVVQEVFRLDTPAEGSAVRAVVEASNGFALVELEAVTSGSLPDSAGQLGLSYRRQLANAAASVEALAMVRQLRDAASIEVYEDNLR
jgi:peptidyl-prolyl cis-trans isomerase D